MSFGIGALLAFGALGMAAILEKMNFGSLIAPSPLILVFVGCTGASLIGYQMSEWKRIPKAFLVALKGKVPDASETVSAFARYADLARKEGILALEGEIANITDPFLKTGLQLVVDGVDGEEVKEILHTEIEALEGRHHAMAGFFNTMGGYSPTFGLMGTIMGLIGVLGNLSDPAALGHGMALGLLGTLWGVLGANLFFVPIGTRLTRLHHLEMEVRWLTVEGVLAIREGVAARLLVERLEARLSPDLRVGHQQRSGKAGLGEAA